MRVDRFKNATYVTNKVGSEDYEIDYVALGKRSDKVFVRIYQKTREVIEQNYKPWFFQIWEMNGLISVAPLVGAWIEIHINTAFQVYMLSLPSWERGLKLETSALAPPPP